MTKEKTTVRADEKNIDRQLMLIDGQWVAASNDRFAPVENPAHRGSIIAEAPRATAEDVDRAVKAAAQAFESWRRVPPQERGKLMLRIADDFEAEAETVSRIVAAETGNALRTQTRPEAQFGAEIFRYFGGVAGELKGQTLPVGERMLVYTRREPLGVVAGIIPWNSPIMLGAVKIAMAIAAGNTIVLKPAQEAPLGILKIAQICSRHLPPGVLNVITGSGSECGAALAKHSLVRKLSFTGSTEIGKGIMREAADRIVPVSLELGGKSPAIVFPDSDREDVAEGVISGMRFTRQGQSCTAGSRLFLHESIFDSFLDKLTVKLSAFKVGDPLDEATDMGAVINLKQFESICGYIEEGIQQEGARLALGGLPPTQGPLAEGYFLQPTVFADISNDWRIAREEIFGPVLVVIPWRDEEDAIRMANDSHYGLSAYVWCGDITKALRTAHAIESGWVQVNRGLGQFPGLSYGGYKQSGIGREFSLEAMLDGFTQIKSVTIGLQDKRDTWSEGKAP